MNHGNNNNIGLKELLRSNKRKNDMQRINFEHTLQTNCSIMNNAIHTGNIFLAGLVKNIVFYYILFIYKTSEIFYFIIFNIILLYCKVNWFLHNISLKYFKTV